MCTLVFLHLALFSFRKTLGTLSACQRRRLAAIVDYTWLVVVGIGIFFAAGDVREEFFVKVSVEVLERMESLRSSLLIELSSGISKCKQLFEEQASLDSEGSAHEFVSAAALFEVLASKLHEHPDTAWMEFPNMIEVRRDEDALISDGKRLVLKAVSMLEELDALDAAEQEFLIVPQEPAIQRALVFVAPWLLGFALGLRISKVTAQYIGYL